MAFAVSSSAFRDGQSIGRPFTCDGANVPPPLAWSDPPPGTRSFALIMDDPDAPHGTFTHWVVYDIPATAATLTDRPLGRTLRNDFGRTRYGGPCPPVGHGPHRYFFTLYAVDVASLMPEGGTRKALERVLQPHVLGTARLMGRYERQERGGTP